MRKRIVIEIDVPILDERKIGNKIAYAAMKVLQANRGILVSINQEVVDRVPTSRELLCSMEVDAE